MSEVLCSRCKRQIEQPNEDLTERMGELSVTSNETSSTKNLSDMPVDVVGLIIERSDYKEQLILRKTSKSLRALVDEQKPACKSIKVFCSTESVTIDIYGMSGSLTSYVTEDDFKKAAFDDLASTFKNPRLQLDFLAFDFSSYEEGEPEREKDFELYYNNLQCALAPLAHRLSVKTLVLDLLNPSTLLSVLPYFSPGFLEKISILLPDEINWRINSTGMDQVSLLEQWRQAEELELEFTFEKFPMEFATNFKRFLIKEHEIDDDKFAYIKNYLSKMDHFEHCTLIVVDFFCNPDLVYELLGVPVSSNTTEEIFHHLIPDSDYYFEFTWPNGTAHVKIEKKKRG